MTGDPADNQRLAARGRGLVYAIVFGNIILALLYYRGLVHPVVAGVLYWGSGAALVFTIRRVEASTHPEQRGWTWLPLLLGGSAS